MNPIFMFFVIGWLLVGWSIYGYIASHERIITRTKIITVYRELGGAITEIYKDGDWDESLEWLNKKEIDKP